MKTGPRFLQIWRGLVAAALTITRKRTVVPAFTISPYGLA